METPIADEAVRRETFGPPFKMDRMTWIKPSFLWMMCRSGWATKEGQTRILAIDLKKDGFDCMLENAMLLSYAPEIYENHDGWLESIHSTAVVCQWDPERDIHGVPQTVRTLQIGLRGDTVKMYVNAWITGITDITREVSEMREKIRSGCSAALLGLPEETMYRYGKTGIQRYHRRPTGQTPISYRIRFDWPVRLPSASNKDGSNDLSTSTQFVTLGQNPNANKCRNEFATKPKRGLFQPC